MSPAIDTPKKDMELLTQNGLPTVFIARSVPGVDLPVFRGDDKFGISLATNHLISLGHKRIAMIGGTDQTSTGRDRYEGYVSAMRKAGLEVKDEWRIEGPRTKAAGFEAASQFLALPDKPTGAVCWNDLAAIGLMNGIARAGLTPGVDISVTGYDDLEEAAIATPALTTVWNGQPEVGRLAGHHEPDRPAVELGDPHPHLWGGCDGVAERPEVVRPRRSERLAVDLDRGAQTPTRRASETDRRVRRSWPRARL